jgi:hypothetical protein
MVLWGSALALVSGDLSQSEKKIAIKPPLNNSKGLIFQSI